MESASAPVAPAAAVRTAEGLRSAERTRTELRGHEPISGTTVHGVAAALLGLAFVAGGACMALVAAGVLRFDDPRPAPPLVLAAVGIVLGACGVFLVQHGVRDALRTGRARRAGPRAAETPWRFDRDWHRDGADVPRWTPLLRPAFATLVVGAFGAVGIGIAFSAADAPWIVRIGASGFALVTLIPAWQFATRLAQALRYGRTYVRWGRFPAFVGERVTLRFGVTRDRSHFERLVLRLRCVEERYETRGASRNRSTQVVCYALHADEHVVTDPGSLPRPGTDTTVHFDLPADLPGNDLVARPATWWELEVEGAAPGVDYRRRFVLPIYARR